MCKRVSYFVLVISLFFINTTELLSQSSIVGEYSKIRKGISDVFIITEEGQYYHEINSEGISEISFGNWSLVDSILILKGTHCKEQCNIFLDVKIEKSNSDTTLIYINDLFGENYLGKNPIYESELIRLHLTNPDSIIDISCFYLQILNEYNEKDDLYKDYNYNNGVLSIVNKNISYIEFISFPKEFKSRLTINELGNHIIKVQLSLPNLLLRGKNITIMNQKKVEFTRNRGLDGYLKHIKVKK